jgi:hypothetical protein
MSLDGRRMTLAGEPMRLDDGPMRLDDGPMTLAGEPMRLDGMRTSLVGARESLVGLGSCLVDARPSCTTDRPVRYGASFCAAQQPVAPVSADAHDLELALVASRAHLDLLAGALAKERATERGDGRDDSHASFRERVTAAVRRDEHHECAR